MYSCCCNVSIPLFHSSELTGKTYPLARKHTQIKSYQGCLCAERPWNRVHSTRIRETKISGVIVRVLSLTPWRYMHSTVKQTLTSCLLARNICRHAQREGRRKKEQSTKEKEKTSQWRSQSFQKYQTSVGKIGKMWRKVFSDELDTSWIRLEGKVNVHNQQVT